MDETTRKSLSYHLKDCRACRHEAFYYRELFSAERHLTECTPADDFNERLLAEIRLREARSAWPAPRQVTRPRWHQGRRWLLAPALVTTATLAVFWVQTGPKTAPPGGNHGREAIGTVAPSTTPNRPSVSSESAQAYPSPARPRYVYGTTRFEFVSHPGVVFQMPAVVEVDRGSPVDPFASVFIGGRRIEWAQRTRAQTKYLLPIVSESAPRERIY